MPVDLTSEEGQAMRKLIPLATLPNSHFETLCNEVTVESANSGTVLFTKGDETNEFIYLLRGKISLQAEGLEVDTIKADSQSARFALAHQSPRKINAVAKNEIRYVCIDVDSIKFPEPVEFEEESSYMVNDEAEELVDDWMTTLLKSPIFQRLPAENLQKVLMELKNVSYDKGDAIVNQGEQGNYYYLIKSGQCILTRKPSANAREVKLAQLRANDTFGEDSLLSGNPRNVTVTALTDMQLLRIEKEKFITLIKEPALVFITYPDLRTEIAEGHAVLLDVRPPDLFKKAHLEGSINTPFFSLRMQLKTLNRKRKTIIVCDDGKTSEAAAFLLLRHKFNAVILAGGLQQAPDAAFSQTATFNIEDDAETVMGQKEPMTAGNKLTSETKQAEQSETEKPYADLLAENKTLLTTCQQLKQQYAAMDLEKQEIEKKYRMLYKQTEKLKAVLDRLKPVS